MKLTTLLAGVAAVALTAGAASAQDINVGQTQRVGGVNGTYTYNFNSGTTAQVDHNRNIQRAAGTLAGASSWHALGDAVNNNGSALDNDGATFTLTGNVTPDCAYYSGDNATETLDFGQIGIYASDNTGPALAFTMVDEATLSIDTNLAGCNTANTVRIQKTDVRGMVNNSGAGYDTNVFQANLPYSVTATYTAGNPGVAVAGTSQTLVVAANTDQNSRQHGAWKSAMSLDINIPTPTKALLSGSYSGTFGVTIQAGL